MRVTEKMIDKQIEFLNKAMNRPLKPYDQGKAQTGNFNLDLQEGFWNLHEILESGGVHCHFTTRTGREFSNMLGAYRAGLGV